MADLLITSDMTKEAVIAACHKATAFPVGIIIYFLFGLVLFLTGLGFKDRDSSWGRFFWIWATTIIVVGTFLLFFLYSPNTVQAIVNWYNSIW